MLKGKCAGLATTTFLMLSIGLVGCGANISDNAIGEQNTTVGTATEEVAQESSPDPEEQEVLPGVENDSIKQDAQEDSVVSEMRPEAETGGTTIEEGAELYDFSPVSFNLSEIPAMENKLYAEWDGNIYFRQYSDEDMEDGALWASFGEIADSEKELMCLSPDGEFTQVGTDHGYGSMYIVDGRLYSQKYEEREDGLSSRVYSCKLDGSDMRAYDSNEVLAVCGDKIICYGAGWGPGLTIIDVKTGEERTLTDGSENSWEQARYLDATDDEIFFYRIFIQERDGEDKICDTVLYSVDYDGNVRELTTLTHERYALSIVCFEILGDMLYFSAGFYEGSAVVYQGGPICSINKDSSEFKEEVLARDEYFYLYDDGINRVLYCNPSDERGGLAEVVPIVLRGEIPEGITIRACFSSYDRPFEHAASGSLLYYPDTSGVCYELLTGEEREEITDEAYVPGYLGQTVRNIEYVDGKLFFTIDDGIYNPDKNIGWRDYYDRGRTACYCKDMKNGEIRLLYEY